MVVREASELITVLGPTDYQVEVEVGKTRDPQ